MTKPEERAALEQNNIMSDQILLTTKKFAVREVVIDKGEDKYSRTMVKHPGAVVVVTIDAEGKLILEKQWRFAAGKITLELPAGTLDEGEDPKDCAQRELQEEIGYKAGKIERIGGFYSAPGFCSEYLTLFLAQDLEPSQLQPDAHEDIEIVRYTLDEAVELIKNGMISDAKTIAGILQYRLLKE
jgi:ADP-ribose pyrophosphatase